MELRRLEWYAKDLGFPGRVVLEALEGGCWSELCKLRIADRDCPDQDLANVLRALTSGRLTHFALSKKALGPLTFGRLQELYFDHLQELDFVYSAGVPSEMVQEMLMGCVHLVKTGAPHLFVRDIATASKPWSCLGLQELVIFVAKQPDDEDCWDGRVFEQISRLRRLKARWMVEYWENLVHIGGDFEGIEGDGQEELDRFFRQKIWHGK
ncbi:hypothetical protein BGX29_000564 [Mortierella sp. GBA35]|nr:hypothetical protein BGX29_000564 [Mortierella sp. GBA35]